MVSFRMSPEEAEQLNVLAKLSGLSKQEYLIRRVLNKDITIQANPRVCKALRNQFVAINEQLQQLSSFDSEEELLSLIAYMATIMDGLKGDIPYGKQ